jgi:hypothetical protein
VEVGRYRDSRESIGIIWCGVVDGETTEIQNGWETLIFSLDTNKPKVNANFRSDVVDKAPIVFGKMFVNAILFKIFPEDAISDKTSRA